MKAQIKQEIRRLKKELSQAKTLAKVLDIESMIKLFETLLEDLN